MPEPVAIGVDVGGTKLVAATITADGEVLERRRRVTPASDPELLVRTLRELVIELGPEVPVGVGIAGLVTAEGVIRYGPNIEVRDLDLAGELDEVGGGVVRVVNDASAATFAEQRVGAAAGHRDVLLLTIGTGVGGGVVVGGKLVQGMHGFAGEVGHLVVLEGGRPCPCGNRGCLEAYASGKAIGRIAEERLAEPGQDSSLRAAEQISGKAVSEAALADDPFAQQLLTEAGHWLGVGLASLVNVLDPAVVLVGGGATDRAAPWMLPSASATMADRLVGSAWRRPPAVERARLGDDAGMIGAALLAADAAGCP